MSGFTSLPLALGIWGLAGALLLWWLWGERKRVEPHHLLIGGLAIIVVGAVIALAAVIWQSQTAAQATSTNPAQEARIAELEAALERYVRPRELTAEQAQKLEEFLLPRAKSKIEVVYVPSNQEAAEYAARLFNVFRNAEWDASIKAAPHDRTMNEGMEYRVEYAPDAPPSPTEAQLLQRALEYAGIPLRGGGGGRHQGITETKIYLYVGHRPRR